MKKTHFLKIAVVSLALAFMSGCASQGGFKNGLNSAMNTAGKVAGGALDVAKDVGGNLVPAGMENGTRVTPETLAMITEGSTMAEVEALIGPAPDITAGGTGEIWTYQYTKIPHFGQNINEKTIVRFDLDGKVTRAYKTSGGATNTGNPLLDAASAEGYL